MGSGGELLTSCSLTEPAMIKIQEESYRADTPRLCSGMGPSMFALFSMVVCLPTFGSLSGCATSLTSYVMRLDLLETSQKQCLVSVAVSIVMEGHLVSLSYLSAGWPMNKFLSYGYFI